MFIIILFGAANIVASVYMWSIELRPYLANIYAPNLYKYEIIAIWQRIYGLFVNVYRFFVYGKFLVIDVGVTMFSVSILGFGDAVSGGILGLFMSNCVSLFLLKIMRDRGMLIKKADQTKSRLLNEEELKKVA